LFAVRVGKGWGLFGEGIERNPALIGKRVDTIVDRVSDLLDMYPSDLHFSIYLYPNHKELEKTSIRIGALSIFDKTPVSFYSHKNRAIYASVEEITGGVLAHETAHAIINVYFSAPPPARMQEILAQFVDRHLWEE
jgi:hypothetical protein